MAEDVLEILRMDLPEIFVAGGREGGREKWRGFELYCSFCVKEDISLVNGSQKGLQKCLN